MFKQSKTTTVVMNTYKINNSLTPYHVRRFKNVRKPKRVENSRSRTGGLSVPRPHQ